MELQSKRYADLILPVAVPNLYTYHFIESSGSPKLLAGMRVCVQFGKRKLFTALVVKVHDTPPKDYETKEILTLLDDYPVVEEWQLRFWKWIWEYYMCTPGDIFNAALPGGLRPAGETRLYLKEAPVPGVELHPTEESIVNIIENNPALTIDELNRALGRAQSMPLLRRLMDKGIIAFDESLKEAYKPRLISMITLHPNLQRDDVLQHLLNKLERKAPKQLEVILVFLDLCGYLAERNFNPVNRVAIAKRPKISQAAIKALIDKEVFIVHREAESRLGQERMETSEKSELNVAQAQAFKEIQESFKQYSITLLHGVTSSGKTEIYIHLIEEQLKQSKQVLYLLPEIALTAQIIGRLRKVFGERVGVYHSKFGDAERVEVWNNLLGKGPDGAPKYDIILGVRSSVFLPFTNLGLIIVDEEHENTYKQYDPAPRYNARDVAVVLASFQKAKVLLGTATPSLESYFNALSLKYGFVELTKRHLDIKLPEIILANTREARRKKVINGNFTPQLVEEVQKALNANEQIILFQNRRGFSPYLECNECAWIPTCKNCDVNLTYHKGIDKLTCHYCGYSINSVVQCKACGSQNMQTRGFGTEKAEDDIKLLFPEARTLRMDLDSTRKKYAYEDIIEKFSTGQVDILIGTQMVSKGLDFDNVSIVGILNADNMLNFPDFRAFERSFQLMAQVSGRAGRKKKQGKVVIQTSDHNHEIIKQVVDNDYKGFFTNQLKERKQFFYPPYYRLINITIRHRDKRAANEASRYIAQKLKGQLGNRVLGPQEPLIGRVHNWYIRQITVKLEKNKEITARKKLINNLCNAVKAQQGFTTLQVLYDVDPV